MASILRSYKKNIAEGGGILFFSIFFAIIVRAIYLFAFDHSDTANLTIGFYWDTEAFSFGNVYASTFVGCLFVAILAVLASHINTKYVLIRNKTLLPPSFIILLFSCHPSFLCMSTGYIIALLFLLVIDALFAIYQSERKQDEACKVGFLLALSGLLTPVILIYLPVIWLGLGLVRAGGFKAILASLIGLLTVYFPLFAYFCYIDDIDAFIRPFESLNLLDLREFPFLVYNISQWATLLFSFSVMIILISNAYISRHKDKIRIRVYLGLLILIVVFGLLMMSIFSSYSLFHIYIIVPIGALLLSHYFALVERKIAVAFFYITIVFCILKLFSCLFVE